MDPGVRRDDGNLAPANVLAGTAMLVAPAKAGAHFADLSDFQLRVQMQMPLADFDARASGSEQWIHAFAG
jgi:hypothetical protein